MYYLCRDSYLFSRLQLMCSLQICTYRDGHFSVHSFLLSKWEPAFTQALNLFFWFKTEVIPPKTEVLILISFLLCSDYTIRHLQCAKLTHLGFTLKLNPVQFHLTNANVSNYFRNRCNVIFAGLCNREAVQAQHYYKF